MAIERECERKRFQGGRRQEGKLLAGRRIWMDGANNFKIHVRTRAGWVRKWRDGVIGMRTMRKRPGALTFTWSTDAPTTLARGTNTASMILSSAYEEKSKAGAGQISLAVGRKRKVNTRFKLHVNLDRSTYSGEVLIKKSEENVCGCL